MSPSLPVRLNRRYVRTLDGDERVGKIVRDDGLGVAPSPGPFLHGLQQHPSLPKRHGCSSTAGGKARIAIDFGETAVRYKYLVAR